MPDDRPQAASWQDFADDAPECAAAVHVCFTVRKHCTLATLRADGSPRISGTEVELSGGAVWIGSMPGSVKALDLQRDPRLALHSPTVDPVDGDESAWAGEAKLAGVALEVPAQDGGGHRFRVELVEVVFTRVGTPADHLLITSWHPGRGLQDRRCS